MRIINLSFLLQILLLPTLTRGGCESGQAIQDAERSRAIPIKLIAIFSILITGAFGVTIPTLSNFLPALRPGRKLFFTIKAFASGVILATGFIHILPEAFASLTSPCLSPTPWRSFPLASFIAMLSAIATLMVDTIATAYFSRSHDGAVTDEEKVVGMDGCTSLAELHTHATHGHAHGIVAEGGGEDLIRHRVVAQVLELGIVVHSMIIGISLGASDNPSIIKPLVIAICFHQFFEGMGLGGCTVQAQFKLRSIVTIILFFSLTTPIGIAVGIGISSVYNKNSPTALIVEGVMDSIAAGILIYMALVDLLAADFMNPKVQNNGKLQLLINVCLLLGAGLMSVLAKWA
ncbi:hypothetical protein HPP92_019104 [Vanilla planifolia]|uniref:Uncharacterized protein n=1 Tax=Vanilla planifolia TaxID=51239 RepID=A0A835Q886_VANPL|nr:hypothetical protein HPP92_019104 [Vanilla planifolia]